MSIRSGLSLRVAGIRAALGGAIDASGERLAQAVDTAVDRIDDATGGGTSLLIAATDKTLAVAMGLVNTTGSRVTSAAPGTGTSSSEQN